MTDPREFHLTATLRNGAVVTIRHVRPDDRGRLVQAFRKLDPESVYTRFFRYVTEPTEQQLKRATETDPSQHVALVVTTSTEADEAIIASGRYFVSVGADGKCSAEVAFLVEEDYQGQGLASRLLAALAGIARSQGISDFEADVLAENRSMLAVFARSGLPMRQRRDGGVVHISLSLGSTS